MWEYFTLERAEVREILADASLEKQQGIQGQWQQESPFRDVLEQAKRNAVFQNDASRLPCNEERQLGIIQRKIQERIEKSSEWTLERTREACEKGKG